jgi:ATP-dependent DNA helicase RecG
LIFNFPSRHLDRTTVLTAAKAYGYAINGYDGEATIIAKVVDKEKRNLGRKEILKVQFRDSSGFIECVWFQGVKYFHSVFNEGDYFAISGKPEINYNRLQIVHPDFDKITEEETQSFLNTGKIIPFYRIPKELKQKNIGDLSLRRIINTAVESYVDNLEETLPPEIIAQHKLIDLITAVKNYHYPQNKELFEQAKRRFKFEEMFYLELLVAIKKNNYQTKLIGNKMEIKTNLVSDFIKTLPFELTHSQLNVPAKSKRYALKTDEQTLQGDVGSGKTIVALINDDSSR